MHTLSDLARFRFEKFSSIGFVSHSFETGKFCVSTPLFFVRIFRTLPVGVRFVGILILVIGSGWAVRHSSL